MNHGHPLTNQGTSTRQYDIHLKRLSKRVVWVQIIVVLFLGYVTLKELLKIF